MNIKSKCFQCPMNRRHFLRTSCLAGATTILPNAQSIYADDTKPKVKIRIIYSLHDVIQPRPDWPNINFNFKPFMNTCKQFLDEQCPDFEFVTSLAKGEEDAKTILQKDRAENIDGYLVYQLNCWNRIIQTIAGSGKPVLYADFQYGGSGGFLVYTANLLRQKKGNFAYMATSDLEDIAQAVKCFQVVKRENTPQQFADLVKQVRMATTPNAGNLSCMDDPLNCLSPEQCTAQLQESKILAVQNQESGPAEDIFGIPVEYVSFAEVNEAWKNADKAKSHEIAERWQTNATKIIDVSNETLQNSAAMYVGMKDVLKNHNANAITINCLGGFYGGHIHAYPCLGFHEFNNEGLIGACECDIKSTATMLLINKLTQGRPGYISDPVIDTSKRQIIYAHCVAPNKVFGPSGKTNPFSIMTHSEDRQGASVRSILPLGYMTTSLEVDQARKQILFHQGKTIANDPDDRACRTKLAVEPTGDIEKLFTMWDQWSWHRVTAYGDLKEPVYALADYKGWKIVNET